ncbi:MAG: aspartate/glutamate racemase family protein [Alphaproteobacteria bacterium]|nr:aspartate/glutamate racemase family protein [Alphaproteobacteria bacterium]
MKILIANPNTSDAMTAMMVDEARRHCRPDTEIHGISADFGVPYIATRSEMAIAGYALLDTLARRHNGYDAVIVGAFCHAFVPAAKELMPVPVVGIAEAAMRAAQILGRRITIIGLGAPDRGANEDIIADLGMESHIASIRRLPLSGTQLTEDQAAADEMVIEQGKKAIEEDHADVLVLGGAAFAGMAERIATRVPVPAVSPVPNAIALVEVALRTGWRKPSKGASSPPAAKQTTGLSEELGGLFASAVAGNE